MQAASRSATRSRCSTSRNARTPPSDDSRPPSNLTTTGLPEADGFDNQILRKLNRLSHIRQPAVHNAG